MWRQYRAGDPVPANIDPGIVAALEQRRIVVDDTPAETAFAPDGKAIKTGSKRVKVK
jgi:hypothetical protein